jgi:hypothetical protein
MAGQALSKAILLLCLTAARKTAPAAIISAVPVEGNELKLNRFGAALSVLAAAAVMLSACGSDNNAAGGSATTGRSSAPVTCGGKPT